MGQPQGAVAPLLLQPIHRYELSEYAVKWENRLPAAHPGEKQDDLVAEHTGQQENRYSNHGNKNRPRRSGITFNGQKGFQVDQVW